MLLTDAAIQALKPRDKPAKYLDGDGLFLLVMPTGSKLWRLKYRFGGREKQLSLGIYPAVGLADARCGKIEARKLLSEGTNPSEVRKTERAKAIAAESRRLSATRFMLDSDGALSFQLGSRRLALTTAETAELRTFLDATRNVTPKGTPCL